MIKCFECFSRVFPRIFLDPQAFSFSGFLLGPRFAWEMAKTAKKAITCSVIRHKKRIRTFDNVQVAKLLYQRYRYKMKSKPKNWLFGHHLDGKSYCVRHVEMSIMLNKRRGKNKTPFDRPMF